MSQQAIDRRMDSAQDVHPGQPRSIISGFNRPLSVIYSAQPSEAAVSLRSLTSLHHSAHLGQACTAS